MVLQVGHYWLCNLNDPGLVRGPALYTYTYQWQVDANLNVTCPNVLMWIVMITVIRSNLIEEDPSTEVRRGRLGGPHAKTTNGSELVQGAFRLGGRWQGDDGSTRSKCGLSKIMMEMVSIPNDKSNSIRGRQRLGFQGWNLGPDLWWWALIVRSVQSIQVAVFLPNLKVSQVTCYQPLR